MKRIVSTLLALVMLLSLSSVALASDLGVQVIGGPETASEAVSLDDLQLGKTYTIDGYAIITPVDAQFVDCFAQFHQNANYGDISWTYRDKNVVFYEEKSLNGDSSNYYRQASWMDSGLNADFFWLRCDITNAQKKPVQYLEQAMVKVVYADDYEFNGWVRQANFDYNTSVYRYDSTKVAPFAVLDPSNEEAIEMMYRGTFIFGCTLPNTVVEDNKAPLRIEITLGGNELIYNIRK